LHGKDHLQVEGIVINKILLGVSTGDDVVIIVISGVGILKVTVLP
jgi:hypothetical protein